MLLKSLELQGFKTFPDKTTLNFHQGITAVVGPNGSGKSNISDAVRWVLGEQSVRALRCTKMEDVIFGGTPQRRPLGFAEVTLNVDNMDRTLPFDADTVAVTRRYYRSGESEYQINHASVRLKDVNELFMDTGLGRDGYSMIGQGKIDSIVSARGEDRREIFEEAAGISRFRYRKEESEHRLAQAEENMLRLKDILSELESRIGPLKDQSEKAKKYLELAGEKKKLEIGLWLATLDRSGRVLREQEGKIQIAQNQYDAAEQAIASAERGIEKTFQDSNACAAKMDEIRSNCSGMEEQATKKDGEISVLQNDIRHNEENAAKLRGEIEQNSLSNADLEKIIGDKKLELQKCQETVRNQSSALTDRSANLEELKSGMSATEAEIDGISRCIAELTAEAAESKGAEMSAHAAVSEITLRLDAVRKSAAEKQKREQELRDSAEDYRQKLAESDDRIQALSNAAAGYKMRFDARAAKRDAAKQQSDTLRLDLQEQLRRTRLLEDLEQNMEGFSGSVKTVMRGAERGVLAGIRGPLSRIIRVPEQYAVAMETALGGAMQDLVVGTEQDAKRAIAFLKNQRAGRATFLPVATMHGRILRENGLGGCRGFLGIASGLCSFEEEYRGVVEFLLGRIAVAEDLDSAAAIAGRYGYRFRVVTLDGQVVNTGGSFTGGSLVKNSGLLRRSSEIEKTRREAAETRKKAEAAAAALQTAEREVSGAEAELSGAKGELVSAQEAHVHLDAESRRTAADLLTVQGDLSKLQLEAASEGERSHKQAEAELSAKKHSEELSREIQKQNGRLKQISGSRDAINQRCDALAGEIRKLELDCLAAHKDAQSLEASIRDAEERRRGHHEKIEGLESEIEASARSSEKIQEKIHIKGEEAASLRKTAKDRAGEIDSYSKKRMELEQRSVRQRADERAKSEEKEKISHDLALLEEKKANLQKEYDGIVAQLWEEYELTRREAEEQVPERISDLVQAKKQLSLIKNEIRGLGSVNVAAVEEYKKVSGRYEFMKAQVADVEQSRDELEKLISGLTHRMKGLFSARFEQINRNFGETFRDLFGGGSARLFLTDPDHVLNSGIEISVQPPGKIVTHLEALSGGEKSLVAIALYFSIMKVNPPPFCVLDEIEAALDDVNVTRFAEYLRKMNQKTQFIVITHRRGSMEEADVLYGVTMQDEGVSKLLEMPVAQVEAELGIKS